MKLKRVLISIAIGVVCVGIGVGGTLAAQKYIFKTAATAPVVQAKPKEPGPLVPIGEFMVNLQGGAFLKTSITLEGTDAKAGELLKAKDAFLKDKVNSVLSNKALSDVQTPEARDKLRQELLEKLNEVADGKIQNVLFISFIYQ